MSFGVSGMKTGSGYLSNTSADAFNKYCKTHKGEVSFLSNNFFNINSGASTGLGNNYQGFGLTWSSSGHKNNYLQYQAKDIPHCSILTGPDMLYSSNCGVSIISNLFNDSLTSLNSFSDMKKQRINYYS